MPPLPQFLNKRAIDYFLPVRKEKYVSTYQTPKYEFPVQEMQNQEDPSEFTRNWIVEKTKRERRESEEAKVGNLPKRPDRRDGDGL
jgi:hypothetical protein